MVGMTAFGHVFMYLVVKRMRSGNVCSNICMKFQCINCLLLLNREVILISGRLVLTVIHCQMFYFGIFRRNKSLLPIFGVKKQEQEASLFYYIGSMPNLHVFRLRIASIRFLFYGRQVTFRTPERKVVPVIYV